MRIAKKIILKTETRLLLLLGYIGSLVYVAIAIRSLKAVLLLHLFFSIIYGVIYFGGRLLFFFIAPVFAIMQPVMAWRSKKYLKRFEQNAPVHTVVVLGHSDWFKLEAWLKHNYLMSELKALVALLQAEGKNFSFYPEAHLEDVEKLMVDSKVREIYFFGHGDSHCFQLGTEEILYYCDFNNPKYGKDFVHQIHCGTPYGKSLLDYAVKEENRPKCFFFRKPINSWDIVRELKRRRNAVPS